MKLLTVFIPTKDRKEFLYRSLDYYLPFKDNVDFYIFDSNKEINKDILTKYPYIIYRHLPNSNPYYRQFLALQEIKTPYFIYTGDDDFLILKNILKCLYENKMCLENGYNIMGKTVSFFQSEKNNIINLQFYMPKRFYSSLYSIHNTKNFLCLFKRLIKENKIINKPYTLNNLFDSETYIRDETDFRLIPQKELFIIRQIGEHNTSNITNQKFTKGNLYLISRFLRKSGFKMELIYKYQLGNDYKYIDEIKNIIKKGDKDKYK